MSAFTEAFSHPPTAGAIAPGRVNLIGDHTDYNLGLAMPIAIDRTCTCWVSPNDAPVIHALAIDKNETAECPLDLTQALATNLPAWARLACGTAALTLHHLNKNQGLNLAFTSTVPQGSGLSSSAAICVSIASAIESFYYTTIDPLTLARLCQRAEHEFANTPCGLLDQLASIHARANHALIIYFATLNILHTPLPRRAHFVLIDTNIAHDNASGEYAKRRADCESLAHELNIKSVIDVDHAQLQAECAASGDHRWKLARHVVTENATVTFFAKALASKNFDGAGELMNRSHASLADDYRVSLPEIDQLADRVRQVPGVLGCRLTGAGLGGYLVALTSTADVCSSLRELGDAMPAIPSPGRRALTPKEIHP